MTALRRDRHQLARVRFETWMYSAPDNWAELSARLIFRLDQACQRKLGEGRADLFGSVAELRKDWESFFDDPTLISSDPRLGDPNFGDEFFEATLEQLARQGDLVFAYDRQRARSRVFETVHYLRQLRQRLHSHSAISESAPLVEMVKVETIRRQQS